ncbi:MAG: hypothetical protein ACHREM_03525 [Polyangiales bacterium]
MRRALLCLLVVAAMGGCAPLPIYEAPDAVGETATDGGGGGQYFEDSVNGNKWALATVPTFADWVPAALSQACTQATLDGATTWRAPTLDEVRTLVTGCPELAPGGSCGENMECASPCAFRTAPNGCFSSWSVVCALNLEGVVSATTDGSGNSFIVNFKPVNAGIEALPCESGASGLCRSDQVVCVRPN